ncbi:hypothetical protein CPB97_005916 [Podila verticillata]|nr:hypothetical protein CPB97_005916 [Podila verticillata]
MRPTHPLHVVELRELITEHFDRKDLLACILVCKAWAVSLRPVLWESVVVSNLGPDFANPETQDLLRHTRRLEIRMPNPDEKAFWTPITNTILALGTTVPLSSIKLCRHPGTNAFWDALLTCTTLRSLTLSDLHADLEHVYNLWRVAQTVESITFHNATTKAKSNIYCPQYRKPFFRLKHLVLEGNSSLQWIDGPVLPWLRAPNLETIRCTSPNAISWMDVSNLVRDINGTKRAAAEGALFYGPGERESRVDYVRGQEQWRSSGMWIPEDPEELERQEYGGTGKVCCAWRGEGADVGPGAAQAACRDIGGAQR